MPRNWRNISFNLSRNLWDTVNEKSGQSNNYTIRNQDGDEAELLVFDPIGQDFLGEGVTATNVVEFLNENRNKPIHVRINSPGGLVYDGITIFNALKDHNAEVTTTVEGIAASAASIITLAGDNVRMQENASFFIHRALSMMIGNEADMEDEADFLRHIDDNIASTLAARSGQDEEKIMQFMRGKVDGTVFNAKKAKELGFIDEIVGSSHPESDEDDDSDKNQKNKLGDILTNIKIDTNIALPDNYHQKYDNSGRNLDDVVGHYRDESNKERPITRRAALEHDFENVVPGNPEGGSGDAVGGEWNAPALEDFTDESWEDLDRDEKIFIMQHFAWAPSSPPENFLDMKLPHHFPPNHNDGPKASENGVNNALARLSQTEGIPSEDKDRIEGHLNAHKPDDEEDASQKARESAESVTTQHSLNLSLQRLELKARMEQMEEEAEQKSSETTRSAMDILEKEMQESM